MFCTVFLHLSLKKGFNLFNLSQVQQETLKTMECSCLVWLARTWSFISFIPGKECQLSFLAWWLQFICTGLKLQQENGIAQCRSVSAHTYYAKEKCIPNFPENTNLSVHTIYRIQLVMLELQFSRDKLARMVHSSSANVGKAQTTRSCIWWPFHIRNTHKTNKRT